jgi:hypothetical protein
VTTEPSHATRINLPNGRYHVATDSFSTFAAELGHAVQAGCAPTEFTVLLEGYTWADSEPTRPRERRLTVSELTVAELAALAAGSDSELHQVITRAVFGRNAPPEFSYAGTRSFQFETTTPEPSSSDRR